MSANEVITADTAIAVDTWRHVANPEALRLLERMGFIPLVPVTDATTAPPRAPMAFAGPAAELTRLLFAQYAFGLALVWPAGWMNWLDGAGDSASPLAAQWAQANYDWWSALVPHPSRRS